METENNNAKEQDLMKQIRQMKEKMPENTAGKPHVAEKSHAGRSGSFGSSTAAKNSAAGTKSAASTGTKSAGSVKKPAGTKTAVSTGTKAAAGTGAKSAASAGTKASGKELTPEMREKRRQRIAAKKRQRRNKKLMLLGGMAAVILILVLILAGVAGKNKDKKAKGTVVTSENAAEVTAVTEGTAENAENAGEAAAAGTENGQAADGTNSDATPGTGTFGDPNEPLPGETGPDFSPHPVESTKPTNYIISTEAIFNDDSATPRENYNYWYHMDFGLPQNYTDVEGVITFRGNNFRDDPTYGLANMTEFKIKDLWSRETGSITHDGKTWTGSGWTGQPLIIHWPQKTKAHMNMYDWAKEKEDLVEVIYACLDGRIYFTDLKTGEPTRDTMNIGWTFKGAGALDPRGYPIMYVGSGYDSDKGTSRIFIINLLTCEVMYTFGNDDPFAMRGLSYADSSVLIDAASDTMIQPGENGLLYLKKLNTNYDEEAGTLSIDPGDTIKWRYTGTRTSKANYWLGFEDSAAIYKGYAFLTDNGGNLMCIDLNTLRVVWAQDTLDDSNSTPVLSVEDDHVYLYVSTSFHLGWRSNSTATVPIWKIDAETGEIIWQTDYTCYSESGVSGGVQSTIAVGKRGLKDYIYVTVSRTGSEYDGVCACLRKDNGERVWEHVATYAWSSPACVYNSDGTGKVIYCACNGKMYLLDGVTGETDDAFVLSEDGVIEASPAVYENIVVVGTRDCHIWGLELT